MGTGGKQAQSCSSLKEIKYSTSSSKESSVELHLLCSDTI